MTGNMHGLHRKEGEEREENDFYATHPAAIPPLLKVLGWENGGKFIYEPACGLGHLSEPLQIYGHTVISTDLIDRGYGVGGVDFLQPTAYDDLGFDAIITNPPYKYALEFVEKSIQVAPIACHFLNIKFLESARRRKFFENTHPVTFAFSASVYRPVKTAFFRKMRVALFVMLGLYGNEILQVDRKLYGFEVRHAL